MAEDTERPLPERVLAVGVNVGSGASSRFRTGAAPKMRRSTGVSPVTDHGRDGHATGHGQDAHAGGSRPRWPWYEPPSFSSSTGEPKAHEQLLRKTRRSTGVSPVTDHGRDGHATRSWVRCPCYGGSRPRWPCYEPPSFSSSTGEPKVHDQQLRRKHESTRLRIRAET